MTRFVLQKHLSIHLN